MKAPHPSTALFDGSEPAATPRSPVDHYAGTEKLMLKSLQLQKQHNGTFDITFDLEDGAATGAEAAACNLACRLLCSADNQFNRVGIRIHDLSSPWWQQDLRQVLVETGKQLSHLVIPKVLSVAQLRIGLRALTEQCRGLALPLPPVHILIETPRAVHEVWELAQFPEVHTLEFGVMDFVSAHNGAIPATAMRSPGQYEHAQMRRAKTEIVAAALAHGKIPVESVTVDHTSPTQAYEDARRARLEFGFLRKWSIHPGQIQQILNAFAPSPEELTVAAAVLLAGSAASWGPVSVAGTLHDRASYRYYWRQLQQGRQLGLSIPTAALEAFF